MKYGIICAMEEEIKSLVAQLEDKKQDTIGGIDFYSGTINGKEVVLTRSGIGKVQAGVTTGLLIANYKVDAQYAALDCISLNNNNGGGGKERDTVERCVLYLSQQQQRRRRKERDTVERCVADKDLLEAISKAAKESNLVAKEGLIVTGDQFVSSSEKITAIKEIYPEALSCEMEGAAIAQVAYQFSVPFLIIRAMSDVGDEGAGQSFDEFIIEAGKKSANMILNFLKK